MRAARVAGVIAFAAIALSVLAGAHYYVARRLILDPALPAGVEAALLALLAALAASLVLEPIAQRRIGPPLGRAVAWPASLWMGFAFLLVLGLAATDLALWLAGGPALAAAGLETDAASTARARAAGVAAFAGAAGLAGLVIALRGPVHRRVEVRIPRWPRALDGFRVVQVSDLHVGPILGRHFVSDLVERCNALDPDLVAVTGDLVDGGVEQLAGEVAPFAGLRARHGVFFVTGNHDHYSGARAWVEHVSRELGLRVLRNERVVIERDGARFDLAGVDDYMGSFATGEREDLARALAGRDPDRPVVLLAHDPRSFARAAAAGVDLQLSGHTHGGQIWPFRYAVRLWTRWVAGHYREGDSQLYVSRGAGFWGPPMRLFAPAELTELVVKSAG